MPSSSPTVIHQRTSFAGSLYVTAGVAALAGLLFGYDTSVISGAMLFLSKTFHLSDRQLEFAVGVGLLGALIGAACAGYAADRWGRRKVLLATGIGFGVFSIVTGVAPGLATFIAGRLGVGICIGIASVVAPLYIAEIAPPAIRGQLVNLNQLAITIGIVAAYGVDYALAGAQNWRWMFMTAAFPSILLAAGVVQLPESPRWLLRHGQRPQAVSTLRALGRGDDAESEAREIEAALSQKQAKFSELFAPGLRTATIVGVALAVFSQISGINTIVYYAPTVLQLSGMSTAKAAILASAIIGLVNVLVTVVSLLLVDRWGRRPLLFLSTLGMAASLVLVGWAFHLHAAGLSVFYAVIGYIVFFELGLGPLPWLLMAEIYPTRIRGQAMSLATLSLWTANWLVADTFLSLLHGVGPAVTFWGFAAVCFIAFLFSWFMVPETKGKSLETIEATWSRTHR